MVARIDLATDPDVVAGLAEVRLGTASFRRALSLVDDTGFAGPSLLPGWTRSHLVAHVGYNARALARLVTWADTGHVHHMYDSPQARGEEIELGATLRPQALRSLTEHAAIELDVRWRDLPPDRWQARVVTAQGRDIPVSETLWLRTREVWLHAVDLDVGLRTDDIPDPVLRRLLSDVVGTWTQRDTLDGLRLCETSAQGDPGQQWGSNDPRREVSGPLPGLLAWATGRAAGRPDVLAWSDGKPAETAPRWL